MGAESEELCTRITVIGKWRIVGFCQKLQDLRDRGVKREPVEGSEKKID